MRLFTSANGDILYALHVSVELLERSQSQSTVLLFVLLLSFISQDSQNYQLDCT